MGLLSRSEDCCCCITVKAGTLILLYLELFAVILVGIAVINDGYSSGTTYNSYYMDEYNNQHSITNYRSSNKEYVGPLFAGIFILFIIIIAALIGVGKKKPSLLIPYFILRIIVAIGVVVAMIIPLFLEKKALGMVSTGKKYNDVLYGLSGESDNPFGTLLNNSENILYVLIIVEILFMILVIHFAKVVYACYRQIEEELSTKAGIVYGPQLMTSSPPYQPLLPEHFIMSQTDPVHTC